MVINKIKEKIFESIDLSLEESVFLFELIMAGKLSDIDISAILIALKLMLHHLLLY